MKDGKIDNEIHPLKLKRVAFKITWAHQSQRGEKVIMIIFFDDENPSPYTSGDGIILLGNQNQDNQPSPRKTEGGTEAYRFSCCDDDVVHDVEEENNYYYANSIFLLC